ncbi:MAG: hypothetical protein H0T89_11635 [Deltaproteobacteria bacterium]|nr:hypothetical protein [Deltaproteobacteria bacterium]MDQ3298068.1 hypothetical protein [Myxococcota bacterium]
MADVNVHRSQAILRMPVKYVDATLILHDGERVEVIFMLPRSEELTRVISEGEAFVPVMRDAKIYIVARDAIACVSLVVEPPAVPDENALPSNHQRAAVKLRSGMMVEGELRWPVVSGEQRTTDYLNAATPYFELHTADRTYYVIKAHVATVLEIT